MACEQFSPLNASSKTEGKRFDKSIRLNLALSPGLRLYNVSNSF
jgi:hypothetical protein